MMIALKYILAMFLAILPFIVSYALRKKANKEGNNGSKASGIVPFLAHHLPHVSFLFHALANFAKRLYKGMRKSENSRKFFTVILIIVLLIYTYVDFTASESAMDIIRFTGEKGGVSSVAFTVYFPMVSNSVALFLCQIFTFVLFSYRIADWILSWIGDNWNYVMTFDCMLIAYVAVYSQGWFIMAEVLTIYLMAAGIYPKRINDPTPKERKPVPMEKDSHEIKIAA